MPGNRKPVRIAINGTPGIVHLLQLLVLCRSTARTVQVEAAADVDTPGLVFRVPRELFQPLRW